MNCPPLDQIVFRTAAGGGWQSAELAGLCKRSQSGQRTSRGGAIGTLRALACLHDTRDDLVKHIGETARPAPPNQILWSSADF
jgi:hypothetical protein